MRTLTTTILTALLVLALSGLASAATINLDNLSRQDLSAYISDPLMSLPSDSSLWNVTAVFKEAGHTDQYWLASSSSADLTNLSLGVTISHVDLADSYFVDVGTSPQQTYTLFGSTPNLGGVYIYRVLQGFTTANGYDFMVGDLLIALDDYSSDVDYDDFILRASRATPIPGAVWLLGSGFAGLLGLRKKFA